jgi:hypothetical protein
VQQLVKNFEILRSNDKTDWEVIATVDAREGTGRQNYEFTDLQPLDGKSYYRIRINYAGNDANKLSVVRTVQFGKEVQLLKVVPNPAQSFTELRIDAAAHGVATIELFDQTGRKLYSQNRNVNAGLNRITLDNLTQYTPGIYTVRVKVDGHTTSEKLIIRR